MAGARSGRGCAGSARSGSSDRSSVGRGRLAGASRWRPGWSHDRGRGAMCGVTSTATSGVGMLPDRSAWHWILGVSCLSLSHRATTGAIAALLALSPIAAVMALAATSDAVDDAYSIAADGGLVVPTAPDIPSLLANHTTDSGTL